MPKKVSRRSFLKRMASSILLTAGLGSGGYFYAQRIEPRLLDINEERIRHNRIPKSFSQFKIVQFSDTHLGFQYDLDQLTGLIEKINHINPDAIFFTGDLMDAPNQYQSLNKIVPLLKKLKPPFGKYAVYGNHDHGGYGSAIFKNIMEQAGFTLLLNQAQPIELIDNSRIYIIGIDDAMLGKPDFEAAFEKVPKDSYKILLSHAPDLADQAVHYGAELQLSGHSHGGQIKIPFVGALVKPPFGQKYFEGYYSVGDVDPLTLYVNRGLGTTRLPFRFLSRPELTVFTLESED